MVKKNPRLNPTISRINTLKSRSMDHHFAYDFFSFSFLYDNFFICISLKFFQRAQLKIWQYQFK